MGIRFDCQACQKKLNVKSFLAGKRGVCPKCGASINIPRETDTGEGQEPARDAVTEALGNGHTSQVAVASRPVARPAPSARTAPAPSVTHDAIDESPDSVWYVRPPSGGQFGPASSDVMRRWLSEGRVSADSLVWREGWADWKQAAPIFPSLAQSIAAPQPVGPSAGRSAPVVDDFHVSAAPALPRSAGRAKRSNKSSLAVVLILGIACVALIVMLVMVLMSQG